MTSPLTRDDVVAGYRLILDREPEDDEIVERHLATHLSVWTFVAALLGSDEARRQQLDHDSRRFTGVDDARRIEVDVAPGATALLLRRVEATWSKFGETEPYWSVLTSDEYRDDALDESDIEVFYETGAEEVEAFEAACVRNALPNTRQGTVLDLGCGVGRVGEHFARDYAGYVGVDISASHLELARDRLATLGLDHARLMSLTDFLARPPAFDIFYSILALQHSPPPVMLHLLRVCLGRLAPGGYAFFQLPCHLYGYEFRLTEYLTRPPDDGGPTAAMEMHALPQSWVFRALGECGMVPVEVAPYPRIGPIGFSYLFLARKPG